MSRRKKAMERQRKQNSVKSREKRANKEYYKSPEAKKKWEEKKLKRHNSEED